MHRLAKSKLPQSAAILFFVLLCAALSPAAAKVATSGDIARYLAGLPLSNSSSLEDATKSSVWSRHKKRLDAAWISVERKQLSRIREWSNANISNPSSTLFYPFSGPDFLYAQAFFPKATTYVLAGLEPVGREPDLANMTQEQRNSGIVALESSINTLLQLSFFRTNEMMKKFRQRAFPGVVPVLYAFIARSGFEVEKAELLSLGADGTLRTAGDKPDGVRISFRAPNDSVPRILYYFSTDISDNGLKKSGFLTFLKTLAPGDGFIKSASYLPHRAYFSEIRDFMLQSCAHLVQDDTGVPLKYFEADRWERLPFGRYNGPIRLFAKYYQSDMRELFRSKKRKPIDFGIGYRWRLEDSGFLLAIKKSQIGPN